MLVLQPATILAELVAAPRVPGGHNFAVDTISDLGAVEGASPLHALVNGSFVVLGVLLGLGAVLVATRLGPGRAARAAVVLLVVSGISSVAVGLVRLDRDPDLHTLVATPVFLAQPPALLLLALALRHRRRALALLLAVSGVVAVAGAVAFGIAVGADAGGGLAERVSLWTCHLALAALGVDLLRRGVWEDRAMHPQPDPAATRAERTR